jgi:Na+-transporting methylmalonyl-CoA/oxaloacetate decarboxylase gamma subunit
MAAPGPGAAVGRISGAIAGLFILIAAAILFTIVYLAFPADGHFLGLLGIGVIALVFSIVAYAAQAFSRSPAAPLAASWGLLGMGGAVLLLDLVFGGPSSLGLVTRLLGIVLVLIVLAVFALAVTWRARSSASDRQRAVPRKEWTAKTPESAFSYPAAQPPMATPPPPAPSSTPPTAPGGR